MIMKKFFASVLAVMAAALPAAAEVPGPWRYEGEGQRWYWDVSAEKTGGIFLVVHNTNARWVDEDRLRVEFSIRTNGDGPATWNPEVLYDEFGRCDLGAVCDPPLYPVINFNTPLERHAYPDSGRFWLHSATVDCKDAPRMEWRNDWGHEMGLGMETICDYYRERR